MTIANSNVIAKIAAVVAGLSLVAMSFAYAAPAAKADTTSDLQAQISALLAQIAALQAQIGGGSASTGTAVQFNLDLTIGSKGADVTSLQQWLVSKGMLQMPAGVAYGYFGPLTRAAVASYQASVGISPAVGYFGPITRAKVNAAAGTPGGSTGGTTDTSGLKGGEASLNSFDTLGDVESTVDEGDNAAKILGVEFDANDGDVMVERVDVEFSAHSGNGSTKIDRYIDSVSLWMDGKKLASLDSSEASKDNGGVYSFRFTGLNGIVREDDTANLYVAVDAVSNLDSNDATDTWTVSIPVDGIRAVDGAGISETYHSSPFSETGVEFAEMSSGDLDITEGDANPEASVVTINDVNDTNGVVVLAFDVEAKNQDILINDIPVGLVTTEDEGVDGPVKRAILKANGKTIDTVSIPSSAALSYQALFDNLDYTVAEDEKVEFTVEVDLNDSDLTTFATSTTLYATTTGSNAAWDVEDDAGDSVTVGGSLTGETMTFYEDSIIVTLVGTPIAVKSFTSDTSGVGDQATFTVKMDIKAIGSDMYIDRDITADFGRDGSGAAGSGFQFATTSDSTTGTTTVQSVSAATTDSADTSTLWKIKEGATRTFTATIVATAGIDGFAAAQITGVNWTATAGATAASFFTSNFNSFKTDLLPLNLY